MWHSWSQTAKLPRLLRCMQIWRRRRLDYTRKWQQTTIHLLVNWFPTWSGNPVNKWPINGGGITRMAGPRMPHAQPASSPSRTRIRYLIVSPLDNKIFRKITLSRTSTLGTGAQTANLWVGIIPGDTNSRHPKHNGWRSLKIFIR